MKKNKERKDSPGSAKLNKPEEHINPAVPSVKNEIPELSEKKKKEFEQANPDSTSVGLKPEIPAEAAPCDCPQSVDSKSAPENIVRLKKPASFFSWTPVLKEFFFNFWQGVVVRQVFHKIITLIFALAVFSFTYMHMAPHRSVLTYMGVMLLMVLVYAEILVIRDHLWVIEGSMRESRKWRDVFFNQTNLRRQRIRKFLIVLFAMVIFSYIFIKSQGKTNPIFSFMGIILMITVLYYEILNIRDEVLIMLQSMSNQIPEENEAVKFSNHEKFLRSDEVEKKNDSPSAPTGKISNDEKNR